MESEVTPSLVLLDEARAALSEGTGKGVRIAIIDSGIEIDWSG